jgi:hypothetical protein
MLDAQQLKYIAWVTLAIVSLILLIVVVDDVIAMLR